VLNPALALYATRNGWGGKAYCGTEDGGWMIPQFIALWIGVDFYEWAYHRLGHKSAYFWEIHKSHHQFYNPSPFAVIADEYVDQFVRAAPLLFFPMLVPVNMDMFFVQFILFFYAYGSYLHWGHELSWPNAHTPFLNSSYHHYIHHAKALIGKPYHTGFFFRLWDDMMGSTYDGECVCVKCSTAKGLRTEDDFKKIEIPYYSVLLSPSFMWSGKQPQAEPPQKTHTPKSKSPVRATRKSA